MAFVLLGGAERVVEGGRGEGGWWMCKVSDFLLKYSIIFLFLSFFFRLVLDAILEGGGGRVRVVVVAGCDDGGDLPMQLGVVVGRSSEDCGGKLSMQLVVSEGRGSEGFLLLAVLLDVLMLVLEGGAVVRVGG